MSKKPLTWAERASKAINKEALNKAMQNPESRDEINQVLSNFKKNTYH